jgi:hypothetical protein
MDLQALLAKRSANVAGSTTTKPSTSVAGFADALTSAFGNALPTDTFSALGQMVDNRSARQEPDDKPTERLETAERKPKAKDTRDADRKDARTDETKPRDEDKSDCKSSDATDTSAKSSADAQQKTGAVQDGADATDASVGENGKSQTAEATGQEAVSSAQSSAQQTETDMVATLSADTAAVAQPSKDVSNLTGQAAASQANAPQQGTDQNQQGAQTSAQATTAPQQVQQATSQQAQSTTQQATAQTAPQQQVEQQTAVDPLAKQQAQGIAQKLDKSENVAIAVNKTQQPQNAAQTQQTAQASSTDKSATATQTQLQTAVTDVDANLEGNTNGNLQQNLAQTSQPKQPVAGQNQGGVAAANTGAPSVFQQAMAAQGSQTSQAAQANQGNVASGVQQASGTVEGTSSTSANTTTAQPTVAQLNATKSAETTQTAQSAKAAVPKTPVPPKQIVDQIKVNIAQAAKDGVDKINIRLRPTELGRVDVKLEINNDGSVRAMVVADRPETLDVLRRDAAGLDRALQDAGLKTGQDSLNFSLRDQGGQGTQGGTMANGDGRNGNSPYASSPDQDDLAMLEDNLAGYANTGSADGVDIRV